MPCGVDMSEPEIKGIFFEHKQISAGTMGTSRVSNDSHELHYYLKSNPKGEVDVFYLKPDGEPTAIVMESVTMDEFKARFFDCSTHKCEFQPKTEEEIIEEKANDRVSIAEQHLDKNEFHAAAFEFGQAVKVDEKNLKAHLGKGKAHMELGQVEEAKESFGKLSEIDSLYEKENKHLFNEYGIELRKGEMYDMAIENYQKAISIDPDDEALHFNVGRAYHEKGDLKEAIASLNKALSIDPDFKEAKMLLAAMTKQAAK